jgi:hypothetical protein
MKEEIVSYLKTNKSLDLLKINKNIKRKKDQRVKL